MQITRTSIDTAKVRPRFTRDVHIDSDAAAAPRHR